MTSKSIREEWNNHLTLLDLSNISFVISKQERGDVLDTMMEQAEKEREAGMEKVITEDMIAAQSIIFFIAGFETTASMMNFITYVLAIYPDIQERLHQEIEKKMNEYVRCLVACWKNYKNVRSFVQSRKEESI